MNNSTFKLPTTPPTIKYKGISGWTGQLFKNFMPVEENNNQNSYLDSPCNDSPR